MALSAESVQIVRNTSTIFFHLVFIIYIKSLFSSPEVRYTDTLLGKVTICIFALSFGIKISYIYSQHIAHTHPAHHTPDKISTPNAYSSSYRDVARDVARDWWHGKNTMFFAIV